MDPILQSLSVQLAETAVRNTAGAVTDRIGVARARKRDAETVSELEEIVSELLADKAELTRIAQSFEQELVAQRITAEDVQYIADHLVPLMLRLAEQSGQSNIEELAAIVEPLLSVETVMVLQLLGFNFRRAIGEPLTELVQQLITSRAPADVESSSELRRLQLEHEIAYLEVVRDPEAFARLRAGTSR